MNTWRRRSHSYVELERDVELERVDHKDPAMKRTRKSDRGLCFQLIALPPGLTSLAVRALPRSKLMVARPSLSPTFLIAGLASTLVACSESEPTLPSSTAPDSVHSALTAPDGAARLVEISTFRLA